MWWTCFVTDFASQDLHPADIERNKEQPQVDSRDVSSQENSDEDDEAALREQLLKSLAVKRKAKLDAGVKVFQWYTHVPSTLNENTYM